METEPHFPLATVSDTPKIETAAAECSEGDLRRILIQALQDRSEVDRFSDVQHRLVCSDKVIAAVNTKVRIDKFAPVPRERIIAMAEQLRREALRARNEQRLAYFGEQIGKRYADCTLDSYRVTCPEQEKALAALREYAANIFDNVDNGRGIVLFGPAGTGKDHLLAALGREAIQAGLWVTWKNGRDLAGEFREAARDGTFRSERNILEDLEPAEVLILSDPIPPAGGLTPFQADVMFRLVDARYRAMKATWATLNVSGGDEADSRLGAQIVDRLKHDALALFCDWPSYRTARA